MDLSNGGMLFPKARYPFGDRGHQCIIIKIRRAHHIAKKDKKQM